MHLTSASNSNLCPKEMSLVDNNKEGNNLHVKIIFMMLLSLCWKHKVSHCQLRATSKLSQIKSRKITGSAYGKHLTIAWANITQNPAPWWKHGSPFPVLREGDGFQRKGSGHEQGWQEVTPLNQQATSKATSMHCQ